MPKPRLRVTLRRIVWPADFRCSEATLMTRLTKAERDDLRWGDCVCFVSGTGSQVLFAWRPAVVGSTESTSRYPARDRVVYLSTRLRLSVGTFNPELLANYAEQVGLELVGLQRFEQRYAQLQR